MGLFTGGSCIVTPCITACWPTSPVYMLSVGPCLNDGFILKVTIGDYSHINDKQLYNLCKSSRCRNKKYCVFIRVR